MNAPIIEFRQSVSPFAVLSQSLYAQSSIGGGNLPIAVGENSNLVVFRVYNNYGKSSSIASATNIYITVFDSPDPNSHTAALSPVSQSWVRIYETGFGENSTAPALYTQFTDVDEAIGRAGTDLYTPQLGSDGSTTPQIRAGTDTNGVGFIEFSSYVEAPDTLGFASYNVAVSVQYDWVP